jgi:2-C-methyl-D-erythritol 4-phosphate cytidylyltransferase
MITTHVIIPAAGAGKRFQSDVPKPLALLHGVPVIVRTVRAFANCDGVQKIVLAVPSEHVTDFRRVLDEAGLGISWDIVIGGAERSDSVYNALKMTEGADVILVHDGARPLISKASIEACITATLETGAAVVAVPVKSTIKRVDPDTLCVSATLNRSLLWEAQTPQGFRRDILLKALEEGDRSSATDDAMLVEQAGCTVKIVRGDDRNLKITTREDLKVAESLSGEVYD